MKYLLQFIFGALFLLTAILTWAFTLLPADAPDNAGPWLFVLGAFGAFMMVTADE